MQTQTTARFMPAPSAALQTTTSTTITILNGRNSKMRYITWYVLERVVWDKKSMRKRESCMQHGRDLQSMRRRLLIRYMLCSRSLAEGDVCVYMCMYTHLYMCICIYIYIYIYAEGDSCECIMCTCVCLCVYLCVCLCVLIYMCVYVCVCVCVCWYVCVCVCVCVCIEPQYRHFWTRKEQQVSRD